MRGYISRDIFLFQILLLRIIYSSHEITINLNPLLISWLFLQDDQSPLRNMSDTNRSIYAFELPDAPDISVEMFDGSGDRVTPMETNQSNVPSDSDNLHCTICFEEDQLKKHEGKECDLRICHSCLEVRFCLLSRAIFRFNYLTILFSQI